MSRRYITNLLGATAVRIVEVQGDSSEDSDAERWAHIDTRVGHMDVVRKTLDGIAARSEDDGARGFGRHASTIRIGRNLWQSPQVPKSIATSISERLFDDGTFPPAAAMKKAVEKIKKADEMRPQPFTRQTLPYAHFSVLDYGQRIAAWFAKLPLEKEAPSARQAEVLERIRERVLLEFRLTKEGTEPR